MSNTQWKGGHPWGSRTINQFQTVGDLTTIVKTQSVPFFLDTTVWDAFRREFPKTSIYQGSNGYYMFSRHNKYLHRWIAEKFLPAPTDSSKVTVDHIDRNPANNCLCNLRWANTSEQNYNQNKRIRVELKYVPEIWPGFTNQSIATGIEYVPARDNHGEHFAVPRANDKSTKCYTVSALQKYEEALQIILPYEDRRDRLDLLEDQLEICSILLDGNRNLSTKSGHTARTYSLVYDADGLPYTTLQWTRDGEPVNRVMFHPRHKTAVMAMAPDAEGRVRFTISNTRLIQDLFPGSNIPPVGTSMQIGEFIYRFILNQTIGPLERIAYINGVSGDLRDENLTSKSGLPVRPVDEGLVNFKSLAAGDSTKRPDPPVFVRASGQEAVEMDTEHEPPYVRAYEKPGCNTLYFICDGSKATQILASGFSRDKNSFKVDIVQNNGMLKPFIRNNPRYQEIAIALGKKNIPLARFVYTFVFDRQVPDGHCVQAINTFDADVRIENLIVVPGNGGNKKVDINNIHPLVTEAGINRLPYRVRTVEDRNWEGRINIYFIQADGTRRYAAYTRNYHAAIEEAKTRLRRNYDQHGLDYNSLNSLFNRMIDTRQEIIDKIGV